MPTTWLISDPHFGHNNMASRFENADGTKCRPFRDAAHQDQTICDNWRKLVAPNDKIYVLGDVAIPRKSLVLLAALPGDKVLIKGNHDIFKLSDYTPYFRDIRSCHVMDKCILTHIPIHDSAKGRFRANIHGHTHTNVLADPWYVNVCVEHTNYAPIMWETIRKRIGDN
jgi:calcineurin-like phosphoesterase family protein